jgi:hypothetical protein
VKKGANITISGRRLIREPLKGDTAPAEITLARTFYRPEGIRARPVSLLALMPFPFRHYP